MKRVVALVITAISVAACAEGDHTPLVFLQTDTLGVTIAGTTAEQGAELTLGYRGKNVAVIPVAVRASGGSVVQIRGQTGEGHSDALSVLGQFESNAGAAAVSVGLGKFFATGAAANKLADGFGARLSGQKPSQ